MDKRHEKKSEEDGPFGALAGLTAEELAQLLALGDELYAVKPAEE